MLSADRVSLKTQNCVSHVPISQFFIPLLGSFAKLLKATVNFVMSVRPHRTTRLQMDGFS